MSIIKAINDIMTLLIHLLKYQLHVHLSEIPIMVIMTDTNYHSDYQCITSNQSSYFTTYSSVSVLIAPNITVRPSDANIIDGENVSFTCTVLSVTPVNLNIFWETTAINTLPDATTVVTSTDTYTSTLMINSVDVNSTGDYTCVAMNDGGMDTSTATLIVIGK